ncbi:MAG: FtsQ-type POTRA domain-containing protein [bacterium]|nr:FtsQ-type POTRA domain-containing protein [bacterium]
MAKKIVKKKKLKLIPFLIVLLILGGLFFGVYTLINTKTKNIIVKNTNYLNDDYILELADVLDYPSFYTLNIKKMEKKLESSPYIKKAKIKRKFYNVLLIDISENVPLYIDNSSNKVVFADGIEVTSDMVLDLFRVPRIMNYIPSDKVDDFIKEMGNVKKDILGKISDIEYVPNEYDKDRFLLYMDDGNMVYLTLTKFEMINYYNEVLGQLEEHKGILYLDSGNHFEIKE